MQSSTAGGRGGSFFFFFFFLDSSTGGGGGVSRARRGAMAPCATIILAYSSSLLISMRHAAAWALAWSSGLLSSSMSIGSAPSSTTSLSVSSSSSILCMVHSAWSLASGSPSPASSTITGSTPAFTSCGRYVSPSSRLWKLSAFTSVTASAAMQPDAYTLTCSMSAHAGSLVRTAASSCGRNGRTLCVYSGVVATRYSSFAAPSFVRSCLSVSISAKLAMLLGPYAAPATISLKPSSRSTSACKLPTAANFPNWSPLLLRSARVRK
mmetsp:Transcript_25352/g.86823  ORF Transcript_25352/g.86823 Transcript_25352/m.86823 type:complete len:266 (+) Transcript_25352:490-1287(+)